MTRVKLAAAVAIGAAILGSGHEAQAQQVVPAGRVFMIHTLPNGSCPALDWHVVTGANNTLSGMIAWNNMESMARVTGTVSPSRVVNMKATEVGGQGRTATITGQVSAQGTMTANITGPGISCPGVVVPVFVPGTGLGSGGGG